MSSRRPWAAVLISAVYPLSGQPTPQSNQADRFIAKLLQNRYALSVRSAFVGLLVLAPIGFGEGGEVLTQAQ